MDGEVEGGDPAPRNKLALIASLSTATAAVGGAGKERPGQARAGQGRAGQGRAREP